MKLSGIGSSFSSGDIGAIPSRAADPETKGGNSPGLQGLKRRALASTRHIHLPQPGSLGSGAALPAASLP